VNSSEERSLWSRWGSILLRNLQSSYPFGRAWCGMWHRTYGRFIRLSIWQRIPWAKGIQTVIALQKVCSFGLSYFHA